MSSITNAEALAIIANTKGRFFGVTFKKRSTQTLSDMICRFGVKKHLTPNAGGSRLKQMRADAQNRLLRVWSADRQGYRSIGQESIVQLRTAGEIYDVV